MTDSIDLLENHVVRQDGRCFLKTPDGQLLEMHGYGGGPSLDLDPRIDLCKPICEQVLRLWAKDAQRIATHPDEAA